ncbi:MAG TPA: cyclase family protein [Verrucomicrobiae bacterium]|nr:cyclase family protein [Verrucomicrobiae bacterium]
MKIYDISVPLSPDTPTYPGDPPVEILPQARLETDGYATSRLSLSSHSGTHLDAPAHFLAGKGGIDTISPEVTCGRTLVVETAAREIGKAELDLPEIRGCTRLLLKTPNSALWREGAARPGLSYLTVEGARFLAGSGVGLLGIDWLSVEEFGGDGEVHRELLGAGVAILEGIDLSQVPPGWYGLYCLPLKISGGDGAPARAILVEQGSTSD